MTVTIHRLWPVHIHYAALQLCKKYRSERLTAERRANQPGKQATDAKTPASSAGVEQFHKLDAVRLARDRCAGNTADVGAVDTEVLQFAAGHAAKFGNGLTELAPIVERACYVHDNPLS